MKTIKQVKKAVCEVQSKDQKGESLNDQDLMVLLLASLMEEESHGSTRKD